MRKISITIQLLRTDLPTTTTRTPKAIQRRSRVPSHFPGRHQRRLGQQAPMVPSGKGEIRPLRPQARNQVVRNQETAIGALLSNLEHSRKS